MTASPRAELLIGMDMSEESDLTTTTLVLRVGDTEHHRVDNHRTPFRQHLQFVVRKIRELKPDAVAVMIEGEPRWLSPTLVRDLIAGKRTHTDLLMIKE